MKRISIGLALFLYSFAGQQSGYTMQPEPGFRPIEIGPPQLTPESQPTRRTTAELMSAVIERPALGYPPLARAARISGKVEVEVVIDQHGNVKRARAVSGHPLLKDAAVASATQWKFETTRLSQTPTDVIGTVTVDFDLDAGRHEKLLREYPSAEWAANVRFCREAIGKPLAETRRLGLALANLAVSAIDENRADEAVGLFEETWRQNKLPPDARPYYARLLLQKHGYDLERALENEGKAPAPAPDGYLTQALQLFHQAYSDESHARPLDERKLIDIGRYIGIVYAAMGKPEERIGWMRIMLSSSALSDSGRAAISYEMAVALWRESFDSSYNYVRKNQPVPTPAHPRIRAIVDEAYSLIQTAKTLSPGFAEPWFYEKLLTIEELKIETDPLRKASLNRRAMEAQDHYMALAKKRSASARLLDWSDRRPYASGLPSLSLAPTPPPPPPPPPPR
jgi:TonB family protein